MSEYVDFHYMPLEGRITGNQVLKQTEDAINDLGKKVYDIKIDESEIQQAIEDSQEALDIAEEALATVTTNRAVWFNSVAELRSANIETGITAATRGFAFSGDGGHAIYEIRESKSGDIDNGETLIILDNGSVAECIDNNVPRNVDNVVELKAQNLLKGYEVSTKGRIFPNDGDASSYFIRERVGSETTDSTTAYSKTVPANMERLEMHELGGKTLVWNQLVREVSSTYWQSYNSSYTSVTYNDGVAELTILNTNNSNWLRGFLLNSNYFYTIISGHKYFISADVKTNQASVDFLGEYTSNTGQIFGTVANANTWTHLTQIATCETTLSKGFLIYPTTNLEGLVYSIKNPMMIDLTLMFGAGNEPSTVAEFESMFPADYYAYNAGQLLSAGVTDIVSKYKTVVWNQICPIISSVDWYSADETAASIVFGDNSYTSTLLVDLSSNLYKHDARTRTLVPIVSGHKYYYRFKINCSVPMTIRNEMVINASFDSVTAGETIVQKIETADKNRTAMDIYPSSGATVNDTYTVSKPMLIDLTLMFGAGNEPTTVEEFQQMFPADYYEYNAGTEIPLSVAIRNGVDVALQTPVVLQDYPIPASVQALTGYGWSAGDVYNYIDFERKVFVQRVGSVDLGSLSWSVSENYFTTPDNSLPNAKFTNNGVAFDAISEKYMAISIGELKSTTDLRIALTGFLSLYVRDSSYNNATTFATAMNGVYLYYELTTPIETDISAYLTDDILSVEGGGTLTFPNSNGDDYRIPVPSEEIFSYGDIEDGDNIILLNNGNVAEKLTNHYEVRNIASTEKAYCVALVDQRKHAILFDLSDETNAAGVISALHDVVNVDAVCISHYHHDHYGDYATIFNALPHENCVWYIPTYCTIGSVDTTDAYNALTAWIMSHDNTYVIPVENERVRINNVYITFNNCGLGYWQEYALTHTFSLNLTCITAFVEFGGTAMQIMADLYYDGVEYWMNTLHACRRANIYQAPHHGATTDVYVDAVKSVNPDVVILDFGTDNEDVLPTKPYTSPIVMFCEDYGIPCFDVAENGTFTLHTHDGNVDYTNLIPSTNTGFVKSFASLRDASYSNNVTFGSSTGLIDVLLGMPENSVLYARIYSAYQIAIDLGMTALTRFGIKVTKTVGANRNYNTYSEHDGSFDYTIEIYSRGASKILRTDIIYGRYVPGTGFSSGLTQSMTPTILTVTASKAVATDTDLALTLIDTESFGGMLTLDTDNNIINTRINSLYRVTMTGVSDTTTMTVDLCGYNKEDDTQEYIKTFYIKDGASATHYCRLLTSRYYKITSATSSTNQVSVHLDFVTVYALPNLPEDIEVTP